MKELTAMGNLSANGALKRLCGNLLGTGLNRDTYELKQAPDKWVVKIQKSDGFDNVKEWILWSEMMYVESLNKWFARSLMMNVPGTFLIQERVDMTRPRKDFPRHIPAFFTDLKYENFGFAGDQLKCVDYGCVMLTKFLDEKKLRYAKWWTARDDKKAGTPQKIKY